MTSLVTTNAKLVKVGHVMNILNSSLIIEAIESMPPLDLDSVLFTDAGTSIGHVDDVFGPVRSPHYSIKSSLELAIGSPVFFIPQADSTITKFVFVDRLIKEHKGTDASWEHDNEPPEDIVEFSDDEEEKLNKKRSFKPS